MSNQQLITKAKTLLREIEVKRASTAFKRAMGWMAAKELLTFPGIEPRSVKIHLKDLLVAGEVEPRILELIPAIVLKTPDALVLPPNLPADLAQVLREIRSANAVTEFRGIPPRDYLPWIPRVGHAGKQPALLRSFRFSHADNVKLNMIKKRRAEAGQSTRDIDIIREGLTLLLSSSD